MARSTILSHPSLAGINSGSGISGSTAWHGAFRFRQYLTGVKVEAASNQTAIFGSWNLKRTNTGRAARTSWFAISTAYSCQNAECRTLTRQHAKPRSTEFSSISCGRFADTGRNLSHNKASPNHAPKVFADEAEAKKAHLRKADFEEAMRRLFANKKITVENYGKPSNPHERIGVKNAA